MTENNNSFSLRLAQEYISSEDQFPVNFDDAWQWLDYARKDTAKRAFLKCGFVESLDYQSLHTIVEREIGATQKEVIKLSVECFKTWAMMSQTEQGKQVRLYFLECEKIAKNAIVKPTPKIPQTYAEALLEAGRLALENEKLLAQVQENKPKVDFANAIAFSEDSVDFNTYAKMIGTGRNRLMQRLRDLNILMKNSTLPYQKHCDAGYFEASQEILENGKLVPFALITGKGQLWLHQKLTEQEFITRRTVEGIAQGVLAFSGF